MGATDQLLTEAERAASDRQQLELINAVADRCGRREGETIPELLLRLRDEASEDDE